MSEAIASKSNEPKKDTFRDLFGIRNYRLLISGQLVSAIGDGVYALSLIWAMKILTGSAVLMSIVLAAEIVPTILFGIISGVLVDRGNQKKFMLISDLARGLIICTLVVLFFTNLLHPWMLILSAALTSVFDSFFLPAKSVAIRSIVPEPLIPRAQSISSTIQTVVGLAAPAIAGVLLMYSLPVAFLFNAVTFFVSFLLILLIKEKALQKKATDPLNMKSFTSQLVTGYKTIVSAPILRGLIIYLVLVNFMLAPIAILFPLFVEKASELAIIEIAFFIGVLIGSVGINLFGKVRKVIPMVIGLILMFSSFGLLAVFDHFYLVTALVLVAGIGSPLVSISLQTLFILKVPREVLGRSQSTMRVLLESSKPVSLLLTGGLLVYFSIESLFIGIALFGGIVVLLMVLNPVIRKVE